MSKEVRLSPRKELFSTSRPPGLAGVVLRHEMEGTEGFTLGMGWRGLELRIGVGDGDGDGGWFRIGIKDWRWGVEKSD